ncbi:TPA: hypothetical protein ACWW78_005404 [Escherichia coli]
MIYRFKTDFMRQIAMLFSLGYTRWFGGEIPLNPHYKFVSLKARFDELYAINATAQQRFRRREKGVANCKFLVWFDEKNATLLWVLLATEGDVYNEEKFYDGMNKKTRISVSGYELKIVPHRGRKPSVSWAMKKETYEKWHADIKKSIRTRNDENIEKLWYSLRRVAGFSELRRQVFKLQRYAMTEWKRSRRGEYPYEKIFVGWLGRFKQSETITDEELLLIAKSKKADIF